MYAYLREAKPGLIAFALLLTIALAGCAAKADYSARFVRYETTAEGTRIAIVSPIAAGADEEQDAYTDIGNLEPGEIVFVRGTGKDWDQPQAAPEAEIVGRSKRK
jgi:hypothetical protein